MSAGPVLSRTWPGTLTFSTRTAKRAAQAPSYLFWFQTEKGGREMVKQRFLTHFKPWLFAVIRVVVPIVGYQLFNKARTYLQYAPLNSVDVLLGAVVALVMAGLLCGLWAWGEWCWFKLQRLRGFCAELKRAFRNHWGPKAVRTSQPVTRNMA